MPFTKLLVPTYTHMLKALSDRLAKAAAQMPGAQAEALLSARLAPDMFPLSTQIRFACVQAQEAVHRLRGSAFPAAIDALLDEGRHALAAVRRGEERLDGAALEQQPFRQARLVGTAEAFLQRHQGGQRHGGDGFRGYG